MLSRLSKLTRPGRTANAPAYRCGGLPSAVPVFTAEIKQFKKHITLNITVFSAAYHGLRVNTPFEFAFFVRETPRRFPL